MSSSKNSNPILAFILGIVVATSGFAVMCYTNTLPWNCAECNDNGSIGVLPPDQGVVIGHDEYEQLKLSYQQHLGSFNPNDYGSYGGRIGKMALQKLLTNLAPEENYVEFRFGYSELLPNPKTYLMFISTNTSGTPAPIYIRNGGDMDSWCPPRCMDGL